MTDPEPRPAPPSRPLSDEGSWLRRRARRELGAHLRPELDSTDLAQQAQLELLRNADRVEWGDHGARRGWLGRVVANLARQAARRRRSTADAPSLFARLQGAEPTASARAVREETALDLRARVAALPERTRRVVELRFWEDCTHEEIARRLGIRVENARVLLHRGLERLRRDAGEMTHDA